MKKIKLIIDQGNTQTKLALFQQKVLLQKAIFTDESQLKEWEKKSSSTIFSSVGDVSVINECLEKTPLLLNASTKLPVVNHYYTLETLGNDRIAGAIGASALFPKNPVLVIDAGTCITIDLLTKEGYQGGSIAPGIHMRLQSLYQQTTRLPLISVIPETTLVGKNTNESIQSGVINGVLAEIDGMIDRYKSNFSSLKVLVTGGDYSVFDKGLKNSIFAYPDLVLKGLNEILDYNEAIS